MKSKRLTPLGILGSLSTTMLACAVGLLGTTIITELTEWSLFNSALTLAAGGVMVFASTYTASHLAPLWQSYFVIRAATREITLSKPEFNVHRCVATHFGVIIFEGALTVAIRAQELGLDAPSYPIRAQITRNELSVLISICQIASDDGTFQQFDLLMPKRPNGTVRVGLRGKDGSTGKSIVLTLMPDA